MSFSGMMVRRRAIGRNMVFPFMNPANSEEDDIRPEYNLASMQVRRMGKERKSFAGHTVRLEDDVAEMFPSAEAVNEALRLVMRIMQQNQELASVATKIRIGHDSEK